MNHKLINEVYDLLSEWDYYVAHDLHQTIYEQAHRRFSILIDITKLEKAVQKTVNELKKDFFLYQNVSSKQNENRLNKKYKITQFEIQDFKHNVTLGLLSL